MSSNNVKSNNSDREKTRPYKVQNGQRRRPTKGKSVNGKNSARTRANTQAKRPEARKTKKGKKNKFSDRHPKLMMFLKIVLILFLLLCVIGAGIIAGMFFGLFGDEFEITKEELKIGAANSIVVDIN